MAREELEAAMLAKWAVWETFKPIWDKGKLNPDRIGALVIGIIVAVAAERVGMFYYELFVGVSGVVVAKYVADLKDKVFELFGIGE